MMILTLRIPAAIINPIARVEPHAARSDASDDRRAELFRKFPGHRSPPPRVDVRPPRGKNAARKVDPRGEFPTPGICRRVATAFLGIGVTVAQQTLDLLV